MTDIKTAAELIAKAGFTMLDYTPRLQRDDWKNELCESMKIFEYYGLTVHQTHSPFNRYGTYGKDHKLCLERCAEATELMGAKYMVAHGDEFDFENMTFSPESALQYNHDLYLPYVKRAEEKGYKIAFETVFEDMGVRRYTSKSDELMAIIKSFDSESAVCCWDFGHANVSFGDEAPDVIRKFGSLIQCTHLHDNTGVDAHQIPMTGDIKWDKTMSAFRDIGYDGVLSIEYAHGTMPEPFTEDLINISYKTARYLGESMIK